MGTRDVHRWSVGFRLDWVEPGTRLSGNEELARMDRSWVFEWFRIVFVEFNRNSKRSFVSNLPYFESILFPSSF